MDKIRVLNEIGVDQRTGSPANPGGLEDEQPSSWDKDQEGPVSHELPINSASEFVPKPVPGFLALPTYSDSHSTEFVRLVVGHRDRYAVVVEHR